MISKYAIYCRVSTRNVSRQSSSIEHQKKSLFAYAKEHALVVSRTFEELTSSQGRRVLFNEMLCQIKDGEINSILVSDISRLSRNEAEMKILAGLLEKGKIKEIRTPVQSFTPGSLIFMASMFECEKQALSRSIKRGIAAARERKMHN